MSAQNIRLLPETLRSIDASTFTGSYQAVGTPLANPSRILKFTNNCSVDVTLSWDGSNDNEYIPAGGFMLIDIASDREDASSLWVSAQTQFYVKASAGTGTFYLSTYYA